MARNDVYLSLCLEQASLSPLHYRHGCIVVRGGKVLGKGYNDYRSGFNGGAQSTGRLSSAGASNALRAKKLGKHSTMAKKSAETSTKERKQPEALIAFGSRDHSNSSGGGALSNTPLSMHSEMMAINSALSLSSAIACQGTARSTQWLQKPCFKLSGRSKQRARLQHLKTYADAICRVSEEQITATERRGGSHSEESRFEVSPPQLSAALSQPQLQRGGGGGRGEGNERVETSESSQQQCPPPRAARPFEHSQDQFLESAAAYERQQRETPEAVPVRSVRRQSVSSSWPSRGNAEFDTSTSTT